MNVLGSLISPASIASISHGVFLISIGAVITCFSHLSMRNQLTGGRMKPSEKKHGFQSFNGKNSWSCVERNVVKEFYWILSLTKNPSAPPSGKYGGESRNPVL